jgi:hypothetical protein
VLDPDGQLVLSLSGGVEDPVRDSGCRADHRDFAEALHPDVVEEQVGLVDEVEVDLLDVGVDRDGILLQRGVEESAEVPVDLARLPERLADAPRAG